MELTGVDLTTETVRTERLLLRPPRPEDTDPVYRACQDPEAQRWLLALPEPYTRESARAFVEEIAPGERADGRALTTIAEADGELVGACGLHFVTGRLGPEIGYWIAPWARGRGYAAEAAGALAEWGLAHGAPRVHLFADVRNTASLAVARKAGFAQEGVVRRCLQYRDGSRGDAALFGRVSGD
ncbi:GNAT family N-acetyltransferase [Blastococcus deserti]|uniref:GNAT family N-acetyltransferase n=1 Tax=Blastococcus deserti TaxID=2259033 RepID=A0ABW4X715_9ACTN